MSFWKQKHVLIALIVAPVLALISYFAVDLVVSEKPQAARAGAAYPLVAKSNCRYAGGQCALENARFKLLLTYDKTSRELSLSSSHSLQSVVLGFALESTVEDGPYTMAFNDEGGKSWRLVLIDNADENSTLRIVVKAGGAFYFADTVMTFVEY